MNQITPKIIENRTEKVRDFILGLQDLRRPPGVRASAMIQGLYNTSTVRNSGCHAQLKEVDYPIVIGGGFFPKETEMEIAGKFWNWITDKEKSPWKKLMQNGIELVISPVDNLPLGWILPHETVSTTPFLFQKNFCILTRVFTEKYPCFEAWDKLLKRGLSPADAFYLCSFLQPAGPGYAYTQNNTGGAHWPITDYFYKYYDNPGTSKKLDFKAFRSGEIIDNDKTSGTKGFGSGTYRESINGYFQELKASDRSIFDFTQYCQLKTAGGSFSSKSFYELDDIIDGFYRWQDQEGILDVR